MVTGLEAWHTKYDPEGSWAGFGLGQKVGAFVEGGANFVGSLGIAKEMAVGIIAVLVASFAATTLDTATRLQRYVIQELTGTLKITPLTNKYAATGLAVALGAAMAMVPGPKGIGTGGLILWPLFGATNPVVGRSGVHGDRVLSVASQPADLVCRGSDDRDAGDACLGPQLAAVQRQQRLVGSGNRETTCWVSSVSEISDFRYG